MSCDAIAFAATLWLASTPMTLVADTAAPAAVAAPQSVANEPLFADIVRRASTLKAQTEGFRGKPGPVPAEFKAKVAELAALDLQGHKTLAARGGDSDLKCILRGISEDLPLKLSAVEAAKTPEDRDLALRDMVYLLNDNVEVITAPPRAPA
jgi:hypothetical protein